MFGLFKRNDNRLLADVSQRLLALEFVEANNRKVIRTLFKFMDEAERVQARMAKAIADQTEKIRVLNEQVAEHVEKLETQAQFNDFVAATGMDGSDEVKKHERQLAGLFSWCEKANAELATIKGKL
jgi:uncharacterized coiled-coil protein SlyX